MSIQNVLIKNMVPYHFEIIESIIRTLVPAQCNTIYILQLPPNPEFASYICKAYSKVKMISRETDAQHVTLHIHATVYPHDMAVIKQNPNHIFVSHRVASALTALPNVWFLTPLAPTRWFLPSWLPPVERNLQGCVLGIQGNIVEGRRNFRSLIPLLQATSDLPYKIKIVGRGELPGYLKPWSHKIVIAANLNFIDFHKAFSNVTALLPLIDTEFKHGYFTDQLTSTISYAEAYHIPLIAHENLKRIYERCTTFKWIPYSSSKEFIQACESFVRSPITC